MIGSRNLNFKKSKSASGQRLTKSKNPELLAAIEKHFDEHGFYTTTTKKLQLHLRSVLPAKLVPSVATLNQVLKSTFHLKFGAL